MATEHTNYFRVIIFVAHLSLLLADKIRQLGSLPEQPLFLRFAAVYLGKLMIF